VEATNPDDTVDEQILSKSDALEIVSRELQSMTTPEEPFVIVDSHTIEKPYGWVFFYNSKKFAETSIFSYTLAGNGPVIFSKYDGTEPKTLWNGSSFCPIQSTNSLAPSVVRKNARNRTNCRKMASGAPVTSNLNAPP
jgi:hypothetical protein